MHFRRLAFYFIALVTAATAFAQETGSISGKVTATDGSVLPGVTVEARSNALPQPRVTTTDTNGEYQLPALQPGTYTLQFTLGGMQSATRRAEVIVRQKTTADVKMGVQGLAESITVTAESSLVDKTSTALQSGLTSQEIQRLPVGQDYRDLLKLSAGVQQTPESIRGPSAGGSGQDNVYLFDGVNVTLPLYGNLSSEPSTNDIAQVTTVKGGAKATDFDRAGGFTIDTVSKSGTNKFSGEASFRLQNHSMTAKKTVATTTQYDQDQNWTALNLGGPILTDRLFFYGSYYRPKVSRSNQANVYGALPKYSSTRNEGFGKLTLTPTSDWLINGSFRDSKTNAQGSGFGATTGPTTGSGGKSTLQIGILEGSWVTSSRSFGTFKFNNFTNRTGSTPDLLSGATPSTAVGTHLDLSNLASLGNLTVPCPTVTTGATPCTLASATSSAFNTFIAPFVTQYGYNKNGSAVGGGTVGSYDVLNDDDDFFRKNGQLGYNLTLGTNMTHDLHAGYQRYVDTEELHRISNGWGDITILGGTRNTPSTTLPVDARGKPIYFQATFLQATLGSTPVRKIHAEYHSQNFELNDTIHWANWSFNAGVIASNDTLYGQGLKNDSSTLSGYVLSPGTKYKMYNVPFNKMIQPRVGATWAYNGEDTVYTSYARYNPAANSLPRAASFDRNYTIRFINAYFDQNGNLIGSTPLASSAGKLFVANMDPRQVQEYLVGTAQQINNRWSARLYGRYRHADHFWEDTNNTARIDYNAPAGIPHEPYIPDLNDRRLQIGNGSRSAGGSSYVIAQLDGAFTKYYEATMESDWRGTNIFLRGSYTWSHYYGNFDQDDTTGCTLGGGAVAPCNDQSTYIGSSNIADGAGRQLWNLKYGDLHGDRRHLLKLYGTYLFPWRGSAGAYAVYQSGQPWETWNTHVYDQFPDNGTSDTIKFAEPAGSRRAGSHYQLDLNYTQNIPAGGVNLQLVGDVFNVFDQQTGYAIQPSINNSLYGQPSLAWPSRRFQLSAKVQF